MGSISKSFALILILLMAMSSLSLLMVKPACAQSGQTPNYSEYIPTPAVPQFTLNFVQSLYNEIVTDPYTGVNTNQQVNNSTIEVIIKNQPFSPYNYSWTYKDSTVNRSTSFWYDVQSKGHYSNDWTEVYVTGYYPTQSNTSDYTVLSLPQNSSVAQHMDSTILEPAYYPAGGQVDFRVRAIIGGYFPPVLYSDINLPLNFISKNGSWSNTQTITIPESSTSPNSTPTVPEFPTLIILPLFAVIILLSIVFIRKRIPKK